MSFLITQNQIQQIEDACYFLRDKLLIRLLTKSLRLSEALNLCHNNFSYERCEIQICRNTIKSSKQTIVSVSSDLLDLYTAYIQQEYPKGFCSTDLVFVNFKSGNHLNYSSVASIFKKLSVRVGFHVTPSSLRTSSIIWSVQTESDEELLRLLSMYSVTSINFLLNFFNTRRSAEIVISAYDHYQHQVDLSDEQVPIPQTVSSCHNHLINAPCNTPLPVGCYISHREPRIDHSCMTNRKFPDSVCHSCKYHDHDAHEFIVCALHPSGHQQHDCPDFTSNLQE